MNIIKTDFEGLLIFEPKVFKDDRGTFFESWTKKDYKNAGINEEFLQDNVSVSKKNVLRGLHFQKNQGQLVTVTYGRIFDVVVDIRPYSKTHKKHFSIELSDENSLQLYMPPGFAHGFCVLSDMAIINYKCTQYYDPNWEGVVAWNDSEIGIEWPQINFKLSEKDAL